MAAARLGRLRKGAEFDTAYAQGTVSSGPLFVVRTYEANAATPRWGFAVGKKLAPKAVDRNRMRRKMREAARECPLDAPLDVIVTAKAPALTASYADIRRNLASEVERSRRRGLSA